MRVVLISYTHELHRELAVPPGDLLIHAGDFTRYSKQPSMLSDFNGWLGALPHRYKIIIPGDHEYLLEDHGQRSAITNAILLVDSGVEVEDLKTWGSPVTPLYGGAFGKSRAEDRKTRWARIPKNTDILITHGPPFGVLDAAPGWQLHEGCPELREAAIHTTSTSNVEL